MKVSVAGNIVTITSKIRFYALRDVGKIVLKNEKGEQVYGAKAGTPALLTKVGASFDHANAEGYACCNVMLAAFPAGDFETPEDYAGAVKDVICEVLEEPLAMLEQYEDAIVAAVEEKAAKKKMLKDSIELN
jgi:hypothetical protein